MDRYITKKLFQSIINETASGFKPNYPKAVTPSTAPAPIQKPVETPIKKSDIAKSVKPIDPADYDKVELVNDPKVRSGKEWAEKGGNFPIKRNGKVFYVSRSVAVSMYAFCQDKWGNWCVLANQRGPGCDHQVGLWNVPAGFLDYNETAEEAAVRETWEETGVDIPLNLVKQMGTNSTSDNVRIRHSCVLPGTIDDYPTSDANCEPGEVSAIAWIPTLDAKGKPAPEIFQYKWVRNPKDMVAQAYTMLSHIWEPKGYSGKEKNAKDRIVWHLRNEIRNSQRANILLDELLKIWGK